MAVQCPERQHQLQSYSETGCKYFYPWGSWTPAPPAPDGAVAATIKDEAKDKKSIIKFSNNILNCKPYFM